MRLVFLAVGCPFLRRITLALFQMLCKWAVFAVINKKDKKHEHMHAVFLEDDLLSTSVRQRHSFATVVAIERNVVDSFGI